MALKPDRDLLSTDVSYFMNVIADPGVGVFHVSAGSGAAMDQATNVVGLGPSLSVSSGVVVGVLISSVVNKDLTRTHLNHHKDEVQVGSKVTIMTKGYVVTDKVVGQPTAGTTCYVGSSGLLVTVSPMGSGDITKDNLVRLGRFRSKKDANGFAKVEVNLA